MTITGSCKWCKRPIFEDGGTVCECCDLCGRDLIDHYYDRTGYGCPVPEEEPKISLDAFIAAKTAELIKFKDDWEKDIDSRYPEERPKDPWVTTKAKWEERYSDRADL